MTPGSKAGFTVTFILYRGDNLECANTILAWSNSSVKVETHLPIKDSSKYIIITKVALEEYNEESGRYVVRAEGDVYDKGPDGQESSEL